VARQQHFTAFRFTDFYDFADSSLRCRRISTAALFRGLHGIRGFSVAIPYKNLRLFTLPETGVEILSEIHRNFWYLRNSRKILSTNCG
jgi:hypothetical protein